MVQPVYADCLVGSHYEIFAVSPDGTSVKQLTSDATYDSWWPKLAPDGSKIAFMRTPAGNHDNTLTNATVWTMNPDGSSLTQRFGAVSLSMTALAHIEWGPDSSEMVFACSDASNDYIKVVSTTTWAVTKTPYTLAHGSGNAYDPAFNPSNQAEIDLVVFTAGVYVASTLPNLDAQTITGRLNNGATPIYDPYVSPDGTTCVFLQNSGGNWSLQKCTWPAGGSKTAVVADSSVNSRGMWISNSKLIFHRLVSGETAFTLATINSDGTGLTRLGGIRAEYPTPYVVASLPLAGVTGSSADRKVKQLLQWQSASPGTRKGTGQELEQRWWAEMGWFTPPFGDYRRPALELVKGSALANTSHGDREYVFWGN